MAQNKRRKLDGDNDPASSPTTSAMSAFQRLRALQAASKGMPSVETPEQSSPVDDVQGGGESETTPARAVPNRRNKRRPAAVQRIQSPMAVVDESTISTEAERGDSIPPTPVLTPIPGTPRLESKRRQMTQYSSLKPNKKNFQQKADGQIRIITSEGERLVILGSYGVRVQEGEATIAGATLTPLDLIQWVHAPHCHALPVLRVLEGSVIELHPHPGAPNLRRLAKLNPAFGRLWNESVAEGTTRSSNSSKELPTFQIIFSSDDTPKKVILQELVSPPEWNKKLASLVAAKRQSSPSKAPIIFLCGPKSSGKSTFGRLLANRLITDRNGSRANPWSTIMLLDIDPGQPEFSPPGVISLCKLTEPNLSPSFCHPSHFSVRSHAIAAVTPALDPSHFLECILDLFSHYSQEFSSHPLIINTPGWIQGTGLDILTDLIKSLSPTEVIYMSQDGPEDTVSTLQSTTASTFSTLPSSPQSQISSSEAASSSPSSRTALSLRTMSTMSYFHLSPSKEDWNPSPLSSIRPWKAIYSASPPARKGFKGILCYDNQPSPELLAEMIDGMVLALVHVENPAGFRTLRTREDDIVLAGGGGGGGGGGGEQGSSFSLPLINNPYGLTLHPRHSRLLSLVLVRGVDTAAGELQLLVPPTPGLGEVLSATDPDELVLVSGKFDTPTWSYSEELYKRDWDNGEGVGDEIDAVEEEVETPWVTILRGGQGRSVGSQVWRVRRDLGRNN